VMAVEQLTVVGPGSEWFWAAISGLVLAVTFVAIYRQLRLARNTEASRMIDGFYAEWNAERMLRYRLAIIRWLVAGSPPASMPRGSMNGIANFWEKLAALGRRGHLDTTLLWDSFGNDCVVAWYDLAPWATLSRDEQDDPRVFEHFEWLADRMIELDRRSGAEPLSRAVYASVLAARLAATQEKLRIEVALRSPDPVYGPTARSKGA
jgi:hypothetical protein